MVARLRQTGAIILGKTVTTPYAYLDPPPTRNPWNLDRTPGGSSSGSAAAVACGMCLAALGTQTGGSLTRPASYCGVCSLKPTYGRLPLDGVLPLAPSLDHLGVMTRTVADLIAVYRVVADHTDYFKYGGTPLHDPLPMGLGWGTARVKRKGYPPLGVEVTSDYFPALAEPEMSIAFSDLLRRLEADEPWVDSLVLPSGFADVPAAHGVLMAAEAAAYHSDRLGRHPEDYPSRIRELVERGQSLPAAEVVKAQRVHQEVHYRFTQRDVPHCLMVPAATAPAPNTATTGDATFNSPWSFLGLPTVSFPFANSSTGLPLAVQCVGERFTEDIVLQIAESLETRLEHPLHLPPVPS